jgi:competence protein ComEC
MMKLGANLKAQVLKVGHHGSRYATSGKFLGLTGAQAAIISAGADNKYGHPTQTTLDRLRESNVQIYRTDLHGELAVVTDGKNFQVQPERQADALAVTQGRQASGAESE